MLLHSFQVSLDLDTLMLMAKVVSQVDWGDVKPVHMIMWGKILSVQVERVEMVALITVLGILLLCCLILAWYIAERADTFALVFQL